VSLGLREKLYFVLGEQRRVLGYHKAKVRRSIGARISRLVCICMIVNNFVYFVFCMHKCTFAMKFSCSM